MDNIKWAGFKVMLPAGDGLGGISPVHEHASLTIRRQWNLDKREPVDNVIRLDASVYNKDENGTHHNIETIYMLITEEQLHAVVNNMSTEGMRHLQKLAEEDDGA
jgi:hypothetical protein